jgi:Conserved protein/domain typically associated with flavoprotein oxygenases, DIM6/NTAB family
LRQQIEVEKNFCPHPMQLFLYGTYEENGMPHFSTFCWLTGCWHNEELHFMISLDGTKITKNRIEETGVFSANIVTEKLLPLADALGHGYASEKLLENFHLNIENGHKINVPLLLNSPLNYELKVDRTVELNGSTIFICKILNTHISSKISMTSNKLDLIEIKPALTGMYQYFSLSKKEGVWEEWKK